MEKNKIIEQKAIYLIHRIIEEQDMKDFYELDNYVFKNCETDVFRVFIKNHQYFNNIMIGKYIHEKRLKEELQKGDQKR